MRKIFKAFFLTRAMSTQSQIQSQIPPEIIEIIRKARRYGVDFVTPYEFKLVERYFERHLDVIGPTVGPTEPIVDLSQCADEMCKKSCELCDFYFKFNFRDYEICSDRKIVLRGAYYYCYRGIKLAQCTGGSLWDLVDYTVRLAKQIANEPIKIRPSKTTRSGYEYIMYHAKLYITPRIPPPSQHGRDEYDVIRIEDFQPRRFAATIMTYLTLYNYYMLHL
jgi:hypothetical protein